MLSSLKRWENIRYSWQHNQSLGGQASQEPVELAHHEWELVGVTVRISRQTQCQ